jgi:hypothetical protein
MLQTALAYGMIDEVRYLDWEPYVYRVWWRLFGMRRVKLTNWDLSGRPVDNLWISILRLYGVSVWFPETSVK